MYFGRSRSSSSLMTPGTLSCSTRSVGPGVIPATGAPESASGKTSPEAMYATSGLVAKFRALIFADVE